MAGVVWLNTRVMMPPGITCQNSLLFSVAWAFWQRYGGILGALCGSSGDILGVIGEDINMLWESPAHGHIRREIPDTGSKCGCESEVMGDIPDHLSGYSIFSPIKPIT